MQGHSWATFIAFIFRSWQRHLSLFFHWQLPGVLCLLSPPREGSQRDMQSAVPRVASSQASPPFPSAVASARGEPGPVSQSLSLGAGLLWGTPGHLLRRKLLGGHLFRVPNGDCCYQSECFLGKRQPSPLAVTYVTLGPRPRRPRGLPTSPPRLVPRGWETPSDLRTSRRARLSLLSALGHIAASVLETSYNRMPFTPSPI